MKIAYIKDLHSLLQRWMKVREAIIPPKCPFVFPNLWRCRLTDLANMVSAFATKAGFNIPTPWTIHLVVEVKAMCLPPSQKQAIARSLSHSSDMTEKHYRAYKGKNILTYKSVGSILLGAPVLEEPAADSYLFQTFVHEGHSTDIAGILVERVPKTAESEAKHRPKGLLVAHEKFLTSLGGRTSRSSQYITLHPCHYFLPFSLIKS